MILCGADDSSYALEQQRTFEEQDFFNGIRPLKDTACWQHSGGVVEGERGV